MGGVIMAKRKFYAVRVGKVPGIYQTWSETEQNVKGFPGAQFKSFPTLEEAERHILSNEENKLDTDNKIEDINKNIQLKIDNLDSNQVIAFVDGSYSPDADGKEKYGFGAVIITSESEINLFRAYVNSDYMDSRNVAGEIEGVRQAILWAIEKDKKEIIIYYDYEGIEKWANKEWKANKLITREYAKFFDEKSKLINIEFKHTKAHSGITYNERADELAKRSLLSHGYKTYNDGSIYFIGLSVDDWLNILRDIEQDNKELDNENKIYKEVVNVKDYLDKIEVKYKKDKLVINCYRGNKSYVQGRQSVLFQKLISYAIETLPTDNYVIETLNNYHALSIEEIEVENRFNNLIPDFPSKFSDTKHRNNLLSAVFNTMLVGYMPDYTCLITPVFRAMEYYLHRILSDKLGKSTTTGIDKNNFAYFNKNSGNSRYYYNSAKNGLSEKQINFLNDLYNYYRKIRHPYSHWSQNSIDSPVISDMNVARDLILEGFKLINKYYIMF